MKKGAVWWLSNRTRDGDVGVVLKVAIGPDLVRRAASARAALPDVSRLLGAYVGKHDTFARTAVSTDGFGRPGAVRAEKARKPSAVDARRAANRVQRGTRAARASRRRPLVALLGEQVVGERMLAHPARRNVDAERASRPDPDPRHVDRLAGVVEQDREAQREQLRAHARIGERGGHLVEAAAAAEHEHREPLLLLAREAGHVGIAEDVGAVLVEAQVRHGVADLVQQRRPRDVALDRARRDARRPAVEFARERRDALGVRAVDVVAIEERRDRGHAAVAVLAPAQEVVEHAEPQRAADRIDARDVELGDRGRHHREPAREHRRPLGLEALELQVLDVPARSCASAGARARPA